MKPLPRIRKLQLIATMVAITGIWCGVFSAFGQEFRFSGSRKQSRLSFTLIKNLIIVPLFINGKGPFNFILDTGVSPMIITDPSIIDSLKLMRLRPTKIIGLGKGPDIDAQLTNEMSVVLAKAKIDHIPAAILKEDLLGLSNYVGMKIHGLLGYYFFNSFVVSINYPSQSMRFRLPNQKKKIKGQRVPFELLSNKPYILVNAAIPGQGLSEIKVLVDNGAGHALSLERWKEDTFPLPDRVINANLGTGLSGPISGKVGRIASLSVGGFDFKAVVAAFPIYDDAGAKAVLLNRNGNLGADLLSRFNMTFDYKNNCMYLTKNANFKRPFDHDMSGLEVYTDEGGKKRFYVMRIEPESPAEVSGLQVNDEILAINFTTTERMDLNEISRLFRSGDGRNMLLTLNRSGELIFKLVKLRRRI